MENKLTQRLADQLSDQVWFQELKSKWEELTPQSRQYIKYGAVLLVLLLCLGFVIRSAWSVRSIKKEIAEKQAIIQLIQSANDELRRIKDSTPSLAIGSGHTGSGDAQPWPAYIDSVLSASNIDKSASTVTPEKAGAKSDLSQEALIELSLKRVSIRQVVRLMHHLETGTRPIKVRNITIDTKADPTGYMDATLHLSAFSIKN